MLILFQLDDTASDIYIEAVEKYYGNDTTDLSKAFTDGVNSIQKRVRGKL